MKKSILFVFALVASMTLSSCGNSTERMVEQFEKACKAKDYDKIEKLADKLSTMELTEEQENRVAVASAAWFMDELLSE